MRESRRERRKRALHTPPVETGELLSVRGSRWREKAGSQPAAGAERAQSYAIQPTGWVIKLALSTEMSRSPGKRRRRPAPLLAAMPRRLLLRPRPRYRPSAAWLYRLCGSGRKPKGLGAGTTDNGAASAPTRHMCFIF